MITLSILLLVAAVALVATVITIFVGGFTFIVAFGDIIVAVVIIWMIIKHFWNKHK